MWSTRRRPGRRPRWGAPAAAGVAPGAAVDEADEVDVAGGAAGVHAASSEAAATERPVAASPIRSKARRLIAGTRLTGLTLC